MTASDRLWVEVLNYASDVSTLGVTLSLKGGTAPYEPWHGRKSSLQHFERFGTVGYAQKVTRAHSYHRKENSASCWALRITTR